MGLFRGVRARLSESEEVEEELDASESVEDADAEECAGRSGAAPPGGAAAADFTISRSSRRPVGRHDEAIDRTAANPPAAEKSLSKITNQAD